MLCFFMFLYLVCCCLPWPLLPLYSVVLLPLRSHGFIISHILSLYLVDFIVVVIVGWLKSFEIEVENATSSHFLYKKKNYKINSENDYVTFPLNKNNLRFYTDYSLSFILSSVNHRSILIGHKKTARLLQVNLFTNTTYLS